MSGGLRATILLTGTEVLRLSRTEQVYRYFLVPTLVGIPVSLMLGVLVASFEPDRGRVAIPLSLDPELELVAALEAAHLTLVPVADPYALWEAGRVDVAILTLERGDGIGARRKVESATEEAWLLTLVSDDHAVSDAVAYAARQAGDDVFDAFVGLAGSTPSHARVASVKTISFLPEVKLGFDLARAIRAYVLLGLGAMSMFFLTLPMVADRREGLTETMRVLPTPIGAMLWSRPLAVTLLQVLGAALMVANLLLILPLLGAPLPGWRLLAEVPVLIAGLFASNTLFVAVGVASGTPKAANNSSSLAMMIQVALLLWGVFGAPPSLVPIAGAVVATTTLDRVLATFSSLVFAAAILAVCARLLHARVGLVLARLED